MPESDHHKGWSLRGAGSERVRVSALVRGQAFISPGLEQREKITASELRYPIFPRKKD